MPMYDNPINLPAVIKLAAEEAPNHPALKMAGHFWASMLDLRDERREEFANTFAFYFVQSILLVGGSMRVPYGYDIMGPPLCSQILLAVCSDLGIDPQKLPCYQSIRVTPDAVIVKGKTGDRCWWKNNDGANDAPSTPPADCNATGAYAALPVGVDLFANDASPTPPADCPAPNNSTGACGALRVCVDLFANDSWCGPDQEQGDRQSFDGHPQC